MLEKITERKTTTVEAEATFARRAFALAFVCSALLTANGNDGVVSAFSPPYTNNRAPPSPPNSIVRGVCVRPRRTDNNARATRLAYKYKHGEDDSFVPSYSNNETAAAPTGILVDAEIVRVEHLDVNAEIGKDDVIHYNDLDPIIFDNGFDCSFTTAATRGDISEGGSHDEGLIHELKDVIKQKNIQMDDDADVAQKKLPKAIEPSKSKPSKKYVSPIQMIKKVPRVKPIRMSTVFFLRLAGDPMWPTGEVTLDSKEGHPPPPAEKEKKPEARKGNPDTVKSWKTTTMDRSKSNAFQATNYLEALSKDSNKDVPEDDGEDRNVLRELRDQQAQLRREKLDSQRRAFIEANRRTNPKEAMERRKKGVRQEWTRGTSSNHPQDPSLAKKEEEKKQKMEDRAKAKRPAIESWKTKMGDRSKSTAFQATNYLEALSGVGDDARDKDEDAPKDDDVLRELRDQQAQMRHERLESQKRAFVEANRRTKDRNEGAIEKRIEEAHRGRKRKEREKLERLYVERKERIDARKRDEERERQEKILEGKAEERVGADDSNESSAAGTLPKIADLNGKRGIPIVDILSRPPVVRAPPLLVGGTLTVPYSDLTPFQKRAVEVARGYHEEHRRRTTMAEEEEEATDGCEVGEFSKFGVGCGIQAAPIVAIIDSYTASVMDAAESSASSTQRFATLASIEVVGHGFAVKFTGVGRVFLHSYFSTKDAALTEEEEELNELLARIQEFDKEEEFDEEDRGTAFASEHEEEDEEEELPVVMAEFDLFLDDSSILSHESIKLGEDVSKKQASSMHAITELYRTANKVYRLHEERKKLVAGLRAGVARLKTGRRRITGEIDGNCFVEFEDCDGLGLVGGAQEDSPSNDLAEKGEMATEDVPVRSRLETMVNYGLGSYGIFSTIPELAGHLSSRLEPYYSPAHRAREEYDAEVASMATFRTLESYAAPDEMARALLAPSATQRFELAYEIMMRHTDELNDLVKMISVELMDCGEECTDLW